MMMVSSKGRYALKVMLDLAEQDRTQYTPLKEISRRQGLSQKYLESIMTVLSKAGMVDALHGKGGGYRLNRPLEQYSVGSILNLTESSMAPVSCLEGDHNPCQQAHACRTLPMWTELNRIVDNYLGSVSLADLISSAETVDKGEKMD